MREIITEIQIAAPPERVWDILTDFIKYPLWNPFLTRIVGQPVAGRPLYVEALLPGRGKKASFRPKVMVVELNRELRWKGGLQVDYMFDGEHAFIIEDQRDGKTRFMQRETFTGLLVPFMGGILARTERGFVQMNRALKERAEKQSAQKN